MPNWQRPIFEWDDGNANHIIERHDVYPEEAEQVFYNRARVQRRGSVYEAFGQDNSGRYLFVVCVLRGERVRIISARTMELDERRFYEKRR